MVENGTYNRDLEFCRTMLSLVQSGEVLAYCPNCGMPISSGELLDLHCDLCLKDINFIEIKYLHVDMIAKA